MSWVDLAFNLGLRALCLIPSVREFVMKSVAKGRVNQEKFMSEMDQSYLNSKNLSDEELKRIVLQKYHKEGKRDADTMGKVSEYVEREKNK